MRSAIVLLSFVFGIGGCDDDNPCPAGQRLSCFGADAETCFCAGPACTSSATCPGDGWCLGVEYGTPVDGHKCAAPQDYCHALFAANPSNPYLPCQPYRPGGGGGGTCTGEPSFCQSFLPNPNVECPNDGFQCAIIEGGQRTLCCPPLMRNYCGVTNRCYATIEDAATACQCSGQSASVGCVACNRP